MRLLIFNPGVASFTCSECKQYIYDFQTGEAKTYRSGPSREEKRYLRPANVETPCHKCPRKSPDREHEFELTERSHRTLLLYQRAKATNFHYLTESERTDPIVAKHFVILDRLFQEYERHRQTHDLVEQLVPALVGRHG